MKRITAPPPDSLIDPYADLPEAPPEKAAPAPAPSHALHVPAIHIPLPSRRALLEALLVVALLFSLVGHLHLKMPEVGRPVSGPLHAKLVLDPDKDGYATAVLKSDATLQPKLKALDCSWGWVDSTSPDAASLLRGHATPAFVVTSDKRPDPVLIDDAPKTGAEALSIVAKLRGRN